MGKVPESTKAEPKPAARAEVRKEAPKKKLDCFVMPEKPAKPGLVLVSTSKVQDGCFVMGWQEQNATWLVSDGAQWYGFANNILKANLTFSGIFAFVLLVVLWLNRRVR